MGKVLSKEKKRSIVSEHASFDAEARKSSRKEKNNHSKSCSSWLPCLKGNSNDVKSQDDQFEEEKKSNHQETLNKSQISSVNLNRDSLTEKGFERKEICSSANLHNTESTEVSQLTVKKHELQEQSHSIHMEKKEHDRCHSNYDSASATDNFQPHETVHDDANSYQRKRNKSKFSVEYGHKNAFVNQGGYVPNVGTLAGLPAVAVKVGMNGSSAKVVDEYNGQIQNSTKISVIRLHEEESSVAMEEIKTKEGAMTSAKEKNENPGKRRNKRERKNKNSNIHSGGNADDSIIHSSRNDVMSSTHSEIKQDDDLISSVIIHRQPRGLINLGNTCFFNAVMQNLNQSFLLQHCLSNYLMQCAGKTSRFLLTKAMDDFYKEMSVTKSSYNPSGVFHNICTKCQRFSGGRQQDSHELLRHLLDGLRAEEREVFPQSERRKILTNIDRVFGGHFLTVYTCEECKMPYHVCEPMLDISLPIAFDDSEEEEEEEEEVEDFTSGQLNLNMESSLDYYQAAKYLMSPLNDSGKIQTEVDNTFESNSANELLKKQNKTKGKRNAAEVQQSSKRLRKERSIHDCLKAFTRVEIIKGEYLCMTCNADEGATEPRMTSAKKRTLIYNPPALLTLHLKRFEQSDQGFVKCNDQITFESELDLGPYCSRYCKRNEQNEKNIWYSLYGVVVHGGSLNGGHYVAYVKERSFEKNTDQYLQTQFLDRSLLTNDELVRQVKDFQCKTATKFQAEWKPKSERGSWYYISDCHSSRVDEKEVMRQQAYLLFYERMARENMETSMARDKLENTKTGL